MVQFRSKSEHLQRPSTSEMKSSYPFDHLLKLVFVALFILIVSGVQAQVTVKGYVFDQKKASGIAGAKVLIRPGELTTRSEESGYFSFKTLEDGQYQLIVVAPGYDSSFNMLSVVNGQSNVMRIFMKQSSGSAANKIRSEQRTKLTNADGSIATTGQLKGFITNAADGEPVIFSPVMLVGTNIGAQTDINGFFTLTKIKPGTYTLQVISVGFDTLKQVIKIEAGEVLTKRLVMTERSQTTAEVEVIGNTERDIRKTTTNVSVTKVTPKEILQIPSIGGEPDLVQYMQTIPGIVFTGDQGGQLFIRGGSAVQNLTLLDGMMIYNPFHSIGLYSVFETETIKNADIYTAGFGAEYGGRASSVMDIKTIDGNKKRWSVTEGINPFANRLLIEAPLIKADEEGNGASMFVSVRNSLLNLSSKSLYGYANNGAGLPFSFLDLYGKITLSSGASKISFQGFRYDDKAELGGLAGFGWQSSGVGSTFYLVPQSSTVMITGNVAYSDYKVSLIEATAFPRSSSVNNLNGQFDMTYYMNNSELKYGAGVMINGTNWNAVAPSGITQTSNKPNTEVYAFVKYKLAFDNLILEPSVRGQYYATFGPVSLEPRFAAKYNINERLRVKLAGGLYSQNLIATQSDRDVVSLFYGFVTSPDFAVNGDRTNASSPIQKATHAVLGFEYDLGEHTTINLEPYIKIFDPFISVNLNKRTASDADFILEKGNAQGIDFQVKYDDKKLFLQLGYSFAVVTRQFGDTVYAPNYDRRHNLNVLAGYKFGHNNSWSFDLRWNYGSGFPFTQTAGFYELMPPTGGGVVNDPRNYNGSLGIYYGGLNQYNRGRLPDFHRLDISIKKKFYIGEHGTLELNASVTNAYNRANLFYFDRVNLQRVNQLPLLPALGMVVNF